MGPAGAGIAADWVGADVVFPMHYDTFQPIGSTRARVRQRGEGGRRRGQSPSSSGATRRTCWRTNSVATATDSARRAASRSAATTVFSRDSATEESQDIGVRTTIRKSLADLAVALSFPCCSTGPGRRRTFAATTERAGDDRARR